MSKEFNKIYSLTKIDVLIFTFFLLIIVVPAFFDSEDPYILDEYIALILITLGTIVFVYLFTFVILKRYVYDKKFPPLLLRTIGAIFIIFIVEIIIYSLCFGINNLIKDLNNELFFDLIFTHLIFSSILLGIVLVKQSVSSQIMYLKTESVRKSNELIILKKQMTPHFLFNNLNTLDALMDVDIERAKVYVQRLAHLYQYLLANKDEETVSLDEELTFAKDYSYLINERYGNCYQFNFQYDHIDTRLKYIPTGAIQTLFENIVKHNSASENAPITTNISITKDKIIVKNNIQSKTILSKSFGIGLNNLQTQYELLTNEKIGIQIGSHYSITLPLIDTTH